MTDTLGNTLEVGNIITFPDDNGILSFGIVETVGEDGEIRGTEYIPGPKIPFTSLSFHVDMEQDQCVVLPKSLFDRNVPFHATLLRHQDKILAS